MYYKKFFYICVNKTIKIIIMNELEKQIETLSNEIRNSEKVYPDFRLLDLQRLIDKRDKLFNELEK